MAKLSPIAWRPFTVASAGLLLVLAYHFLSVAAHQGNWTVLFYAGEGFPAPPALAADMVQQPNSHGFDGQFYYYIAHDPLNRLDSSSYVDNPSMRWKRILFPGMAALLSFGQPSLVAPAYAALIWLVTFLGIFVLARLAQHWGYPAIVGLGFLAIPAVAVSVDRMLTDIALPLALLVILLAQAEKRPSLALLGMAIVPLARETGLIFAGSWTIWQAAHRRWGQALMIAPALLPFLGWATWVHLQFGSDGVRWWGIPFQGILSRLGVFAIYDGTGWGHELARLTDYIGAWGILASFVLAPLLFLRGERSYLLLTATLYTIAISVFVKADMWGEAYSYTRIGGPVAVMLAVHGLQSHRWWLLLPMALALPRIGLQFSAVILSNLRMLTSG